MSAKTWYTLQLKAIPERYGLSENVQTLLKTLDWVRAGSIDPVELGRLVRLSPQRRAAIADTITKCANMIKKKPKELKTCVDIIEMCTEVLEIADRPPPPESFPFMKLPIPIRDMILGHIIDQESKMPWIVPVNKTDLCNCPKLLREYPWARKLTLPYTFGPALCDEFFRVFFRKKKVNFRCSCEMLTYLSQNERLVEHLQTAAIHWCGPRSPKAFEMLAKCPRLESLTVRISKSTMTHLNDRAELMKPFFPIPYRTPRMTDVLGLDELLQIRGVKEILVHKMESMKGQATELDRANLRDLLLSKLKLNKGE